MRGKASEKPRQTHPKRISFHSFAKPSFEPSLRTLRENDECLKPNPLRRRDSAASDEIMFQ